MRKGPFVIGKGIRVRASWRLSAVVAFAVASAWLPWTAQARWANVQEVTLGTAQVLEQGALTFGVVSPIAYGVGNDFMLESHPVLDLLLVPNAAGRYRLLDRPWFVLSLTSSYRQSFFKVTSATAIVSAMSQEPESANRTSLHTSGSPGEFNIGPVATWYPSRQFAVTVSTTYAARQGIDKGACTVAPNAAGVLAPVGCPGDQDCIEGRCIGESTSAHGTAMGLEAHWLVRPEDLLVASGSLRYDFNHGRLDTPAVGIWWAHSFQTALNSAHLLLGVSVGRFPVRGLLSDAQDTWPLFPFADLWWRL